MDELSEFVIRKNATVMVRSVSSNDVYLNVRVPAS
jgi:hypothetical protein